jgi:hypothetical protein
MLMTEASMTELFCRLCVSANSFFVPQNDSIVIIVHLRL